MNEIWAVIISSRFDLGRVLRNISDNLRWTRGGVSCQVVTSLGVLHVYSPSPPFSTTLCSFLLPLCHLSCAHFPKQNWAQLKPCWPIIQQIITRLMIENWRQSHSGRLKWSHNGRLMHFSEQIRKQSQEIDSVSLQVNANKIISSPPKIRNLCPRRRVSLTDHLECLLLRDGHGILRLMITGEISPLSRDFGWHPKFDAHKWTSTGRR